MQPPSIILAKIWFLVLLSLSGCAHNIPNTDGSYVISQASLRPVDIDPSITEKVGREALHQIGYEEIIRLAQEAGFVAYKSDVSIQLVNYGSALSTGFVPVFSRYAAAAAVTSQVDSPLPGPADVAAAGVVVIGLVDAGLLDGYLLNTIGEWLVGTRGKLLLSQAKTDEGSWQPPAKEGRGRGANRADGRMVDDAARHAGVADRAGFGKFIESEKRAEGRKGGRTQRRG
jgi:hypothetical protein